MDKRNDVSGNSIVFIAEAEEGARRELCDDLKPVKHLTQLTYQLLGQVAGIARATRNRPRLAARVCIQLINRASNDLRCASLLASAGYTAQVTTLYGSMYEAIVTAAHVSGDEARATTWLAHDDEQKLPFGGPPKLTKSAFGGLGNTVVENIYRCYRKFCVAKHANPVFERGSGIVWEKSEHDLFLQNGPDTSEGSRQILWYILISGCGVAALATAVVVHAFAADDTEVEDTNLTAVIKESQRLHNRYRERWPEG